jgi:hypothetical protein
MGPRRRTSARTTQQRATRVASVEISRQTARSAVGKSQLAQRTNNAATEPAWEPDRPVRQVPQRGIEQAAWLNSAASGTMANTESANNNVCDSGVSL